MDLNDLWAQNKRWLLGVLAGVVVFWIATAIVGTIYDGDAAERRVIAMRAGVQGQEYHDDQDRKQAKAAGDELTATETQLRGQIGFRPAERFVLEGNDDPDLHFDQIARQVRASLVDKAQQFAVELAGENLEWTPPVGREEIQRTLLGLDVLDEAVGRLLDASEEVRAADADSLGLQGIDSFEVETRAPDTRRRLRPGGRRSVRRSDTDVSERIDEYHVSFKFRADSATLGLFLEKCRTLEPPLLLHEGFKVKAGRAAGDPLLVQGRLFGLVVRDA